MGAEEKPIISALQRPKKAFFALVKQKTVRLAQKPEHSEFIKKSVLRQCFFCKQNLLAGHESAIVAGEQAAVVVVEVEAGAFAVAPDLA